MPKFFEVEITTKARFFVEVDKAAAHPADLAETKAAGGHGIVIGEERTFTNTKELKASPVVVGVIQQVVTPDNVRLGHTWLKRKLIEALAVETGE